MLSSDSSSSALNATESGIGFTVFLFIVFTISERYNIRTNKDSKHQLEQFNLDLAMGGPVVTYQVKNRVGESPPADELTERRERLHAVSELPERQQKLLWLHALGLNYVEMAMQTGCTTRTVERQLVRARRALREAA